MLNFTLFLQNKKKKNSWKIFITPIKITENKSTEK
jgi:hypothetical protein